MLAVIRGDADFISSPYESSLQYIESGDVRVILYYDKEHHPKFPNVPIPSEVGMPDIDESMTQPRLIGAPPGLPDNVRAILEKAIKDASEDPGFLEEVEKMRKSVQYLNAKDTQRLVEKTVKGYSAYVDVVKDLFERDKKEK